MRVALLAALLPACGSPAGPSAAVRGHDGGDAAADAGASPDAGAAATDADGRDDGPGPGPSDQGAPSADCDLAANDGGTPAAPDSGSIPDTGAPPRDGGPDDGGSPASDGGPPRPGPCGSWEQPCEIAALPASVAGDTRLSAVQQVDRYSPCAPATPESGPEVVYTLTMPVAGLLRLALDDQPGDGVDNDLHLLSADRPDACLARDNISLAYRVEAGERYWISVDRWFNGNVPLPGPYVLTLELDPAGGGNCPVDMEPVGVACMDRYEAPDRKAELPLVMYTYTEAGHWCEARGKRLCFDDEWTAACRGVAGTAYPYGDDHQPGVCHDEAVWRAYDQGLLNGWPPAASDPEIESLDQLFAAARAVSPTAAAAADHVQWLYQGAPASQYARCVNESGVHDLTGNVEEWTTRRDGGEPNFHGQLKGRYWAETRTCSQGVTTHGDAFRFYEIGFRCCLDP